MSSRSIAKICIGSIELFIAISAWLGGFKLLSTNGMGMPVSMLHGWFSSFQIPALALIFLVGCVNFAALAALIKSHKFKEELSLCAGFSIIIFEFVESYVINHSVWMQAAYFALGIVIVVLTFSWSKNEASK